ncbi:MAG: LacI family DNA-binding transcriptional regulator [Roseitalea sp.]|jgi:LacI family transcriptional regulator|nr:LacI family DNA-binding transcriptional regulator [Roseitalea sp.]MBO6721805.1 LacI family DNA-binding transcriptional regulator [Roseitalea sp.]MBO6744881.1 LacI family DNA-binding transcriptional regulator [Roseitalea sp.]
MVTIKDIARDTGLSPATVARALGGNGPTRPETRQRVHEAADRLGYVVSSAARSMRNQSSDMVGLIVPDIVNRFYSEMARAIAAACDARGLHFLLAVTDDDPDRELRQMRAMVAARAAAVALVPGPHSHRSMIALAERQPFVQLVRRSEWLRSEWFGFEEESGLETATTHLLSLGHRHILLACSGDRYSTGAARQRGYTDALKKHGLSVDDALIRAGEPTVAHGRAAIADIPPHVTAIITAGTLLTEGAVDVLTDRGVSIPGDLSIVGFGIEKWLQWWRGGMTRIIPPVDVLAETCAEHLLSRIGTEAAGYSSGTGVIGHPTVFEIGQTTAPAAT